MKVNTQRLLEMCIDDGIRDALGACKDIGANDEQLAEQISDFIMVQITYYFDFD